APTKICLGCHRDVRRQMRAPFVHTARVRATCATCHDSHSGAGKDQCSTCHGEVVPANAKSVHRPAADGRCGECHDPHGSGFKAGLRRNGDALCAACHERVAAALANVTSRHDLACNTCHEAHGSMTGAALLKAEVPALCVRCHEPRSTGFASRHSGYEVSGARCTGCHDPHGSPRKALLSGHVHEPVAKGDCAACHEPATSGAPLAVKKAGADLCRDCHQSMLAKVFARSRLHGPVAEGACLSCHTPHASKDRGLLTKAVAAGCAGCHPDTIERQRRSPLQHGPLRDGLCTKCHDPHASDVPLLLVTRSPYQLCRPCHTTQGHKHIVGSTRDPRNPNLKLECPSCHRAHDTGYGNLLPVAKLEHLCVNCHRTKG
ncbi:MAG: cytochrome c3 family protein, partial [Myxococcales bacterium]